MNAATFDSTIIAFRDRKPFRPFTVVLLDGERFEVDRHNAIVVRDGVAIYVRPGGIPVIFDYEGVTQISGDMEGDAPHIINPA